MAEYGVTPVSAYSTGISGWYIPHTGAVEEPLPHEYARRGRNLVVGI